MLSKKLPYWNKALKHLKHKDKILAKIIVSHQHDYLNVSDKYFESLVRAIIGQQISVKAAQSIWIKFSKKYRAISPNKISMQNIRALKSLGLSRQKSLYIKNVANFFILNKKRINQWKYFNDDEIKDDLTSIKGIGAWTAQMFLIFSLGRPNVFPLQDLGLMRAISVNYRKNLPLSKSFLNKLKKDWDPWCSVATWFLWRSIDPLPVNY